MTDETRTILDAATPSQNRISYVVELAIITALKERRREVRPKPTIAELEAIINQPEPPKLDILPDGQLSVEVPVFARDIAKAVMGAIYADGSRVIEQATYEADQLLIAELVKALGDLTDYTYVAAIPGGDGKLQEFRAHAAHVLVEAKKLQP